MKGQIFTLDVLASLILITIVVAAITAQFEQVYAGAGDTEHQKITQLAMDISQLGVKAFLNDSATTPNKANPQKLAAFLAFVDGFLPAEYGYVLALGAPASGHGGCQNRNQVAIISRIVHNTIAPVLFNVTVCR